ncbi:MAG: 50S ribosomal protein L18 [Chloroflexota bacterium]|nr:50S ribosomal protein L18 [Chloroflexota bacterium]MCY3637510.1 50S ribosomal protein L18 [Chloroflexota bacterium]MDE2687174.1 50S ribosomal protein L18 [Chloroflexota bacterium]
MAKIRTNKARRVMRHVRVRRKIGGTAERPRLAVYRSLNHVYAQVIDDTQGVTLAAASSVESAVRSQQNGKSKTGVAEMVGELVSERAKEIGISQVVFDRGGYKYHGRVKALADAARKGGLVF